jgi:hypothetical protein
MKPEILQIFRGLAGCRGVTCRVACDEIRVPLSSGTIFGSIERSRDLLFGVVSAIWLGFTILDFGCKFGGFATRVERSFAEH